MIFGITAYVIGAVLAMWAIITIAGFYDEFNAPDKLSRKEFALLLVVSAIFSWFTLIVLLLSGLVETDD